MEAVLQKQCGIGRRRSNGAAIGAAGVYAIAGGLGLLIGFHKTLCSGFAFVQGDPADSRLNNYFLEHSFQWLFHRGYKGTLWGPTFFYPLKDTLSYSDNLFGSAPIYWLIRAFTRPEAAYQLWMMAVCLLTFASFAWLLHQLRVSPVLAAGGALLFAFGASRMAQCSHAQLLPQMFAPMALLFVWRFCRHPRMADLVKAMVLLFLQLAAGIYLGWFTFLGIAAFIVCLVAVSRGRNRRLILFLRRLGHPILAVVLFWAIAVAAFLFPYWRAQKTVGRYSYSEIEPFLPRLASWAHAPAASVDSWILQGAGDGLSRAYEHGLFLGVIPMALVALACLGAMGAGLGLTLRMRCLIRACCLAALGLVCLTLRWPGGFSLWAVCHRLVPGGSAIRAMARIWTMIDLLLLVAAMVVLDRGLKRWLGGLARRQVIAGLLMAAAAAEQLILVPSGYLKQPYADEVREMADLMRGSDVAYAAPDEHRLYSDFQLSVMWAGLLSNTPVVNGSSGLMPRGRYQILSKPAHLADIVDLVKSARPVPVTLCIIFQRALPRGVFEDFAGGSPYSMRLPMREPSIYCACQFQLARAQRPASKTR